MIKKFDEYKLNENLGYKDFFGKEKTHKEVLEKTIRDNIIHIIIDERKISEKSFNLYDSVINEVEQLCKNNAEIYKNAEIYYQTGKRLELLAEEYYDKFYNKKGV